MGRHDTLIIKDTHRGLLYEDGIFRDVLPAGRYQIPRAPSSIAAFFGASSPRVEVVLIDVRGRDRTIAIQELLTADGATISASFVVLYRVDDPAAALHQVKSFEDRLYAEAQTSARRVLRGLSVEEVMAGRDEIGEEILRQVRESSVDYGLEVTGLDFKDLVLPEDLKKAMNRAVLAKKLRQAGAGLDDPAPEPEPEADPDDDSGLILSRASFVRDADDRPAGSFDTVARRRLP